MDPIIEKRRHSASHVLALAVARLFPESKLGIGPVTDDGFYYDFKFPTPITWADVERIQKEIDKIIEEDLPFTQVMVPKQQGIDILFNRGQIFKTELLQDIGDDQVSFYKTGNEFVDLCRGPHVGSTNEIGVVKLLTLTETHWQNNPNRPVMQRISGVAFANQEELAKHLEHKEKLENLDFRELGEQMGLTLGTHKQLIFTPNGTLIIDLIAGDIIESFLDIGTKELSTAPVSELDDIFADLDTFYSHKNRSYKELPLRLASRERHELATSIKVQNKDIRSVYTLFYKSYIQPEGLNREIGLTIETLAKSFEKLQVLTKAEIITSNLNNELIGEISGNLKRRGVSQIQTVDPNEKEIRLKFIATDHFGRDWDLISLKIKDSNFTYVSRGGEITALQTIEMECILNSVLGYMLEDTEGNLSFKYVPVQVRVIPITDRQHKYAMHINEMLRDNGLRSEPDIRSETMQAKIRSSEIAGIPVILIIGEKEEQNQAVSVRLRDQKEVGLVAEEQLVSTIRELNLS